MLKVELKRILKSRSTWWLFAISFVLCLFMGFYALQRNFYDESYYDNKTGEVVAEGRFIRGVEAYKIIKEKYAPIKGEVTPELISEAVRVYQEIIDKYGDDYSVPGEISVKMLGPYSPVYTWISRAFTDEHGSRLMHGDISPEQALNFYQERLLTLERQLLKKYEKQPQVVDYAMSRADSGENFNYSYGIGSNYTFDQLGICLFMVILTSMIITAPIFSSDYASGADDILRCTRQGRRQLALVKLGSAIIISLGVFILCIGAFFAIIYPAFGLDDITSAELLNIVFNPDSLSAIGCMWIILLSGLLTLLAMSCFTLFLSSRLCSSLAVLGVSLAVVIIPTVFEIIRAEGNVLNWIRFCLPSGGVMLSTTSMVLELGSLRFLWISDFVTWSPYLMLISAAMQIPLWFGLAVHSYNKHEVA